MRLLVGGTATYTVVAQISPNATGNPVNTAPVTVPAGTTDPTLGNNAATDTDTPAPAPIPATEIPILNELALMALMLILASVGGIYVRRVRG